MPTTTEQEFMDSQNAISNYLKKYRSYSLRKVEIDQGGSTIYSDECYVSAEIRKDDSIVRIFFNDQKPKSESGPKFFQDYTNCFQVFSYNDGCLKIEAVDRDKNAIKITIS